MQTPLFPTMRTLCSVTILTAAFSTGAFAQLRPGESRLHSEAEAYFKKTKCLTSEPDRALDHLLDELDFWAKFDGVRGIQKPYFTDEDRARFATNASIMRTDAKLLRSIKPCPQASPSTPTPGNPSTKD